MQDNNSGAGAASVAQSVSPQDSRRTETTEALGSTEFGPRAMAAAWDPYEVWLTRVKRPREQRVASVQG